jgi:hypothetical protein
VVFLRAAGGKIAFLREYFDPTRAAKAMNTPILVSNPEDKRRRGRIAERTAPASDVRPRAAVNRRAD